MPLTVESMCVHTIAPEEICPPDNCPLDDCSSDNCPKEDCPKDNYTQTIPPWTISLWFVACIIASRIIDPEEIPRKIVAIINYTRDIFSRRIRNPVPLIDSYFLFLFLEFKLVQGIDFCIRKNFINTMRVKLLRKEEQVKNEFSIKQ